MVYAHKNETIDVITSKGFTGPRSHKGWETLLYTPWSISVCRFSVPMLQAIRMVTDVFVRWQWLLKAVSSCRVVESTYRVTLGRDAEGQIPHRLGQGWRKNDTWLSLLSQFFYFFCRTSVSILWSICGYIHTYLTVYRLYMNYRCHQITLQWNIFTQIGELWSVDWIFIVRGAGLAVTGRIRDIGQHVLQSSFQTGSAGIPCYFHIFFSLSNFSRRLVLEIYKLYYALII